MSKKALIVDYDFFFTEFLANLLETRGYEVVKAQDGKDGISKLEEGLVDFIFTDTVMPKIDGAQFIKLVRKKFPRAQIPIIAVAGNLIEQLDSLETIGADYYLAKGPVKVMKDDINQLMDRVENHPPGDRADGLLEPGRLFPRQATVALMDSVSAERSITESLGLGVLIIDRDAKITRANSMALGILEKSFEEVLNLHVTALFPKREREKLVDALKEVIRNPKMTKKDVYISVESVILRLILSCYRVENETVGWVIAVEEAGG